MVDSPPKVAIACQGGGTHAAFIAGVLTEILECLKPNQPQRFELVGLSGTSAGALCALTAWYGLASKNGREGSPEKAIENLKAFWDGFAASTPAEILQNAFAQLALTAQEQEVPVLGINMPVFGLNPQGVASHALIAEMLQMGVRKEYLDFDAMLRKACPEFALIDWDRLAVRLMLGASEIVHGIETVFDSDCNSRRRWNERHTDPSLRNRWRAQQPLTWEGAAASGTLPRVRRAQQINGGYYWDGLYSQNPPVREFLSGVKADYVPDEIWVIRINPQQSDRPPETNAEIQDRENELIGNLSLNKELDFILIVNELIETYKQVRRSKTQDTGGAAETEPADIGKDYKKVTIRTIKMKKETADELRTASKFDRSRIFIDRLRQEGRGVARDWLAHWQNADERKKPQNCYPDDAAYETTPDTLLDAPRLAVTGASDNRGGGPPPIAVRAGRVSAEVDTR